MTLPMRRTKHTSGDTRGGYTLSYGPRNRTFQFTQSISQRVYKVGSAGSASEIDKSYEATLAPWKELKSSLPRETLSMASAFVALCEKYGAFNGDPNCNVDLVDDGQVMFDWNNGKLPVFTVMIAPGPRVIYVGRFAEGKVTGDENSLISVEAPLQRLVSTIGMNKWRTAALQGLLLSVTNESVAAERHYTLPPRAASSQYSVQKVQHAKI